jgi:fatty-acyl-CoA synthase
MENLLMGHPAVAEAAVIAVPDEKWDERPMAIVVLKDGAEVTPDDLRAHLSSNFAKWQLPERVEFIDEIPRTATGKFKKTSLREQYVKTPV